MAPADAVGAVYAHTSDNTKLLPPSLRIFHTPMNKTSALFIAYFFELHSGTQRKNKLLQIVLFFRSCKFGGSQNNCFFSLYNV